VVIHKPSLEVGYYGADVSGPVFKRIAQKIYTDTPIVDELLTLDFEDEKGYKNYHAYHDLSNRYKTLMPDLTGMSVMDALSLLENMEVDIKVELRGSGTVKKQSVAKHEKLKSNQTVVLEAS
jgi:cell division protein FtsI (penicillin-binding protein 3)